MNNMYNLNSVVQYITHRNKIYSFFKLLNSDKMDLPFDELLKYLNNKAFNINNFIRILKTYEIDISIKEFNLIYIIKYHNKTIIPHESESSNVVIKAVNNITTHINNFDPNDRFCIFKTINRFKRYIQEFNKWKNNDKIELIQELTSEYYRLDNIKQEIQTKSDDKLYINELEDIKIAQDHQEIIMNEIKKVDGLDIFNKLQPIEVQYDKETTNQIKGILEDQFWFLLEEDLIIQPINSIGIIKLLEEIKDIITLILKSRVDMLIEIEKAVNTEQLKEEFDTHYFLDGLSYLLETLRKLQSPEYDELTDNYIKTLKHNMIEGNDLHEFVPKTLRYIMNGYYTVLIEKNQDALVVGHSNTTGVLAGLLTGKVIGAFDLDIYDRVYQVLIYKNSGRLQLLHTSFDCRD